MDMATAAAAPSRQGGSGRFSTPVSGFSLPAVAATKSPHASSASASATGMWSPNEHELFKRGVIASGWGNWRLVDAFVPTRTCLQIKSHAQKFAKCHPEEVERLRRAFVPPAATTPSRAKVKVEGRGKANDTGTDTSNKDAGKGRGKVTPARAARRGTRAAKAPRTPTTTPASASRARGTPKKKKKNARRRRSAPAVVKLAEEPPEVPLARELPASKVPPKVQPLPPLEPPPFPSPCLDVLASVAAAKAPGTPQRRASLPVTAAELFEDFPPPAQAEATDATLIAAPPALFAPFDGPTSPPVRRRAAPPKLWAKRNTKIEEYRQDWDDDKQGEEDDLAALAAMVSPCATHYGDDELPSALEESFDSTPPTLPHDSEFPELGEHKMGIQTTEGGLKIEGEGHEGLEPLLHLNADDVDLDAIADFLDPHWNLLLDSAGAKTEEATAKLDDPESPLARAAPFAAPAALRPDPRLLSDVLSRLSAPPDYNDPREYATGPDGKSRWSLPRGALIRSRLKTLLGEHLDSGWWRDDALDALLGVGKVDKGVKGELEDDMGDVVASALATLGRTGANDGNAHGKVKEEDGMASYREISLERLVALIAATTHDHRWLSIDEAGAEDGGGRSFDASDDVLRVAQLLSGLWERVGQRLDRDGCAALLGGGDEARGAERRAAIDLTVGRVIEAGRGGIVCATSLPAMALV